MKRLLRAAAFSAAFAVVAVASAQDPHGMPGADGHGDAVHGDAHAETAHGDTHGEHHWNLYYGMIAEREGLKKPDLLWRPKGMPPPFFGLLLNYGVLFYVLFRFGKAPIAEALKKRKGNIMRGMDEAAQMKKDAAQRLREFEEKLERIDEEIERVRKEMHEAGQQERKRILAEAKERRDRMERDARLLIEQELKAAREQLVKETVQSAVRSAEEKLVQQGRAVHHAMSQEYLTELRGVLATSRVGQP